jgi:dTMP kinase
MHQRTEILLLQAARAQHVEQVIRPHLERGWVVISDRYADSTLAYQGYGYQNDVEQIRVLVTYATCGLKPDLTLFLDVPLEEGLQRRAHGGEQNRLDALDLAFYQRVRQGYQQMIQAEPERWVVIDASRAPDAVQTEIREVVLKRLR